MHLTILEKGYYLGLTGCRITIKQDKKLVKEIPLTKIKSITIGSKGFSLSTDLLSQCAARGILILIIDFRGVAVSYLYGLQQHAVTKVREAQFNFIRKDSGISLAEKVIAAKISNQRSLLLYFSKYFKKKNDSESFEIITMAAERLKSIVDHLRKDSIQDNEVLLGNEGQAARLYWETVRKIGLVPESFVRREGRGSPELVNSMLNYGYAILSSYVWKSVQNAGLEPYAGFLHKDRPGKPSLILDIMEEYRAWVIDRIVFEKASQYKYFSLQCRRNLVSEIHKFMNKKKPYHGKKVRLDVIIQRQAYRLAGAFADNKKYRPFLFRW